MAQMKRASKTNSKTSKTSKSAQSSSRAATGSRSTSSRSKTGSSAGGRSASGRSSSGRSASARGGTGQSAKSSSRSGGSSKAKSNITTDHEEIRQWAESREGKPACVRGTGNKGDVGMLRLNFPGYAEDSLQDISWDEWFEKFDERGLALLYQDKTARGQKSRFNKLVAREQSAGGGKKTLRAGK